MYIYMLVVLYHTFAWRLFANSDNNKSDVECASLRFFKRYVEKKTQHNFIFDCHPECFRATNNFISSNACSCSLAIDWNEMCHGQLWLLNYIDVYIFGVPCFLLFAVRFFFRLILYHRVWLSNGFKVSFSYTITSMRETYAVQTAQRVLGEGRGTFYWIRFCGRVALPSVIMPNQSLYRRRKLPSILF